MFVKVESIRILREREHSRKIQEHSRIFCLNIWSSSGGKLESFLRKETFGKF